MIRLRAVLWLLFYKKLESNGCEIEDSVVAHICKLCVTLQRRVLRVLHDPLHETEPVYEEDKTDAAELRIQEVGVSIFVVCHNARDTSEETTTRNPTKHVPIKFFAYTLSILRGAIVNRTYGTHKTYIFTYSY